MVYIRPGRPRCEHVFRELYESIAYLDPGFLQLKVLELLMLLGRVPRESAADPYCSVRQAELARHLRDHLLTDREGYVSLSQLAAEHEISVSHLQKIFQGGSMAFRCITISRSTGWNRPQWSWCAAQSR